MLQASTFRFLSGLKKHNDKSWFDTNRPAYEAARKDITAFIQAVIEKLGEQDSSIAGLAAKDCLFRINRDVRFSKDKSPYKTNFGASINRGGKKSPLGGYYVHLEPGGSFAGGGVWMPEPAALARVRQEIDYNLADFQRILKAASYRKYHQDLYAGKEISLTRVPKGYAPDHPAASYLRLKSFFSMSPLDNDTLLSRQAVQETAKRLLATKALIDFLNTAIAE